MKNTIRKLFLGIFLRLSILCWIAFGCSCKNQVSNRKSNPTNWVSIGTINTPDTARRLVVFDFFTSNYVPSYPEGYPNCKVMVREQDVEKVRAILKTNNPPGSDFTSVWAKRAKIAPNEE